VTVDRKVRSVVNDSANPVSWFRAFRRLPDVRTFLRMSPIIIGFVGLVVTIVAIPFVVSEQWTLTTGTAQACRSEVSSGGRGLGNAVYYVCTVTWTDAGTRHTASVDLGAAQPDYGQSVPLRVHGNSAAAQSPGWQGPTALAVGLALLMGGAVIEIRAWRRRSRARLLIGPQ
jgi:hypothetical protein